MALIDPPLLLEPIPMHPPADLSCTCDGNGSTTCWECGGECGFHNCGDDCCPHLEPDLDSDCEACGGSGFIRCLGCKAAAGPEEAG